MTTARRPRTGDGTKLERRDRWLAIQQGPKRSGSAWTLWFKELECSTTGTRGDRLSLMLAETMQTLSLGRTSEQKGVPFYLGPVLDGCRARRLWCFVDEESGSTRAVSEALVDVEEKLRVLVETESNSTLSCCVAILPCAKNRNENQLHFDAGGDAHSGKPVLLIQDCSFGEGQDCRYRQNSHTHVHSRYPPLAVQKGVLIFNFHCMSPQHFPCGGATLKVLEGVV